MLELFLRGGAAAGVALEGLRSKTVNNLSPSLLLWPKVDNLQGIPGVYA